MLARRATLQYVVKQQESMAKSARNHACCVRFFALMRFLNIIGAVAILCVAVVLIILASLKIVHANDTCSDPDEEVQQRCVSVAFYAASRAATFIVVSIFLLGFASLIIAADGCRARCVARFFGFMAYNVWKGLFSIFCGLAVAWVGNEYNDGTALDAAADLALKVIGMFVAGVGLAYMLFGSCNCIHIASTPLKQEFHDYREALRMYHEVAKKEKETHAGAGSSAMAMQDGDMVPASHTQVTITIDRAKVDRVVPAQEIDQASATVEASASADSSETTAEINPFKQATAAEPEENPFKKKPQPAAKGDEDD